MTAERLPARSAPAAAPIELRSGAELVHIVEGLYVRLFRLMTALSVAGIALCVYFATAGTADGTHLSAVPLIMLAGGFVTAGVARPVEIYRWLRHNESRQLTPALLTAAALVLGGRNDPGWWIALPVLWITAVVSTTRTTAIATILTAAGYLAGTWLAGDPLVGSAATARGLGSSLLAGTIELILDAMLARLIIEMFARFTLRLHELQARAFRPPPPLRVRSYQTARPARSLRPTIRRPAVPHAPAAGRLSARELELALLLSDGLRQPEIALALDISTRQVQRLLAQARARAGAATNEQLVAMLRSGGLVPEPSPRTDNPAEPEPPSLPADSEPVFSASLGPPVVG
jgi:DNA-binding CsgD family transcriptional regulator